MEAIILGGGSFPKGHVQQVLVMPDVLLQLEQVSIIGCSIYYQLLLLLEKLQVLYVSGKGEVNQ